MYFYLERGVKEVFNFHIHGALAPAGNFLESCNRLCVIEKPLTAGDDRRRQKTFLIIKFHSMRFKSNECAFIISLGARRTRGARTPISFSEYFEINDLLSSLLYESSDCLVSAFFAPIFCLPPSIQLEIGDTETGESREIILYEGTVFFFWVFICKLEGDDSR